MYGLISQTLMQMIDTIMGWKWDTIFQIFWKEMQEIPMFKLQLI
jgi:hypothetical protein